MQQNQKTLLISAALLAGAGIAAYSYYKTRKSFPELNLYPQVDLDKYLGEWFEIARIPHRYEKGCYNTKAIYSKNDDGTIKVVNSCTKNSLHGELDEIEGKAIVVDPETNAKLKVQFFWPFKGDYCILDIGKDYEYALVGSPDRDHLWILSRSTKINGNSLRKVKNIATREGFDVDRLKYTEHIEQKENEKVKAEEVEV